jgi:hypothetical protein
MLKGCVGTGGDAVVHKTGVLHHAVFELDAFEHGGAHPLDEATFKLCLHHLAWAPVV